MCFVCCFSVNVFVHVICELRINFIYIHSFMHLTVRGAEIKLRKYKFYAINKVRKVKKAINLITITFLKQLHNNKNK